MSLFTSSSEVRRYLRWLLLTPLAGLALVAVANLVIDPYDAYGLVRVAGFNAEKTRRNAEGSRIATGYGILRGGYRTLFLGTSRVQRSFPRQSHVLEGVEFNAGMAGANMFEIVRAARLAYDRPGLECVVIGLDFNSFSSVGKIKGSYWNSPLAEGPLWLASVKSALSIDTIRHGLATVQENLTKHSNTASPPLATGQARRQFEVMTRHFAARYRSRDYDRRRMDLLSVALDQFTARGIQVAGVIAPIHGWQEAALWHGGLGDEATQWRRDLAATFGRYADRPARAPCFVGDAATVWDFAGFQDLARSPAPGPDSDQPHPYFLDTSHSRPELGEAILARMSGHPHPLIGDHALFGVMLDPTPAGLDVQLTALERRHEAYLRIADGRAVSQLLDHYRRADPPEPVGRRFFLDDDDFTAASTGP